MSLDLLARVCHRFREWFDRYLAGHLRRVYRPGLRGQGVPHRTWVLGHERRGEVMPVARRRDTNATAGAAAT